MKKIFLLLFAMSFMVSSQAQQEKIVYTDFEPDLCLTGPYNNLYIDIDNDGIDDFRLYVEITYSTGEDCFYMTTISQPWCFRHYLGENDTILPYQSWFQPNYLNFLYWESTYYEKMVGFKKTVNNENYYAWGKMYMTINNQKKYIYFDELAYCTVPDYPLRWGQTSMVWDVDENNGPSFADIQPNPTNGEIAITGKDLKKAEVFNSVGQQVVSAQCQGDRLTFDLGNQPAGLYFVSVTDTNGRRCVKKVVKQ